jgi:hypothetical protein
MGTCAGFEPSRTIFPSSCPVTMPTSAPANMAHSRQGKSRASLMLFSDSESAPVSILGTAFLSSSLSSWSSGPAGPPAPRPLARLIGRPVPEDPPRVLFRCAAPAGSPCRTRVTSFRRLAVLSVGPCRGMRALSPACAAPCPARKGKRCSGRCDCGQPYRPTMQVLLR